MTDVQRVESLRALQEVGVKLADIPTTGRGVERKIILGLLPFSQIGGQQANGRAGERFFSPTM